MAQIGTENIAGGNTKKPPRERSRGWFFTLNNPSDCGFGTHDTFLNLIKSTGAHWCVFQLEKGKQGTEHYQGHFYYLNPREWNSIKQICNQMHFEKSKDLGASFKYTSKDDTRIAGPWWFGPVVVNIEKPLKIISQLRPFQEKIVNIIKEEPDDRTIYWFWDKKGNIGKTSLAKYICINFNAIFLSGKANDCKSAIVSYSKTKKAPDTCIFHFTRNQEEYISYQALEEVKDGIFFNGKYESSMFVMNSPHVIVFANFPPKMHELSVDRWAIEEITENSYNFLDK